MTLRAALAAAVAVAAALPAVANAGVTTLGLHGWQVQSTARAPHSAQRISTPGFSTRSWLHVRPDDAGAPGTEVGALVQTHHCHNVFFSTNMKHCFGYMGQVGPESVPQFSVPWWFRTTFTAHLGRQQHAELIINGIVGEADVWLNGNRIATRQTVQGAFARYAFDVTRRLRQGANALALRVYPNDPTTMFTLDNVDWSQVPPDNNTGIQFPIQLHVAGPLALSDAHVVERVTLRPPTAALTLRAKVTNYATTRQSGVVSAVVTSPSGSTIVVRRPVSIPAGRTQTVSLGPNADPRLLIRSPQLWWPRQLGSQPLYRLTMTISRHGGKLDRHSETFGIRKISTRLVGPSPLAPHGSRQFLINGTAFMFRGGGWAEDLFLRYSSSYTAEQIAMIQNLGLNGIRTEGKQMPDDFYEQMDRAGILVDAGFQCCDAWQLQDSGLTSKRDFHVLYVSAKTIGEQMRNHPSILNFSWSDNAPTPRQEAVSIAGFRQADFQVPLIASAEYKSTRRLGPSGEKEGPYDWVPPAYWYDRKHYNPDDSSRTNAGGAWGFDSESSAGHTVPTLDSIKRFLSPFERTKLWRSPKYNQYHANYEPEAPGYSFGTLDDLDAAIAHRYGSWASLREYVRDAQVQNYETQRAQFEAYIDHSRDRRAPSTGLVYWQLNKGWPTLLWDLFNYDLDQAGSYFGAKKANEPLHVLYAYDDGRVSVDNLDARPHSGLSVQSNVYSLAGALLDHRTAHLGPLGEQAVARDVLRPRVPPSTRPPAPARTYFVELQLRERGRLVDRNVYWLSTQPDLVNWSQTIGSPEATMRQFADLRTLKRLRRASLHVTAHTHPATGPNGSDQLTDVNITNTSTKPIVAFFIRADVRRANRSGAPAKGDNQVLPIFWDDNDTTLWPGESETLHAAYRRADLRGRGAEVTVSGWNVPTVAAPAP